MRTWRSLLIEIMVAAGWFLLILVGWMPTSHLLEVRATSKRGKRQKAEEAKVGVVASYIIPEAFFNKEKSESEQMTGCSVAWRA